MSTDDSDLVEKGLRDWDRAILGQKYSYSPLMREVKRQFYERLKNLNNKYAYFYIVGALDLPTKDRILSHCLSSPSSFEDFKNQMEYLSKQEGANEKIFPFLLMDLTKDFGKQLQFDGKDFRRLENLIPEFSPAIDCVHQELVDHSYMVTDFRTNKDHAMIGAYKAPASYLKLAWKHPRPDSLPYKPMVHMRRKDSSLHEVKPT